MPNEPTAPPVSLRRVSADDAEQLADLLRSIGGFPAIQPLTDHRESYQRGFYTAHGWEERDQMAPFVLRVPPLVPAGDRPR
jgi:hypothetical protein